MKYLFFLVLINLHFGLFGQLKGEYMFCGGEFSITYTFEKNGRFHYDDANDINGDWGKGTYKIEKDTLILTYEAYLDSGEFDCGRIVVEKGDWDNSTESTESDSIQLVIKVIDCQDNKLVPFIRVSVYEKEPSRVKLLNETHTHTNESGILILNVSDSSRLVEVVVWPSEYHSQFTEFLTDSVKSMNVTAYLFQSYRSLIEAGKVEKFLITEKKPEFIDLAGISASGEPSSISVSYFKVRKRWSKRKFRAKCKEYYYKHLKKWGIEVPEF